jgi:NAD(P)-dependent dehydrogenase (short-subunit alcohol dehydrogenase family)
VRTRGQAFFIQILTLSGYLFLKNASVEIDLVAAIMQASRGRSENYRGTPVASHCQPYLTRGNTMTQTWLITGSSRGIGRALAEAVLEAGHHLVATARDIAQLDDLVTRFGDRVLPFALDVTDEEAAKRAVAAARDRFGTLNVVVNNAGYGDIGSIEETSLADFRSQIETNLFGTIIVTKAAIPLLRAQRSGHFIQFSSVGGRLGAPGRAPYSAAKWAVEGFSEVLAKEMAPLGVKVTVIEPGGFRTDFAGRSTTIRDGMAEYAGVVGAAARMQRDYDGHQPGDPARAAQAILAVAGMTQPPLHLPLGSDAVGAITAADQGRIDEIARWRELSISTDFPAA